MVYPSNPMIYPSIFLQAPPPPPPSSQHQPLMLIDPKNHRSYTKHQQHQIPTINSQRDRETDYRRNSINNLNNNSKSNRF